MRCGPCRAGGAAGRARVIDRFAELEPPEGVGTAGPFVFAAGAPRPLYLSHLTSPPLCFLLLAPVPSVPCPSQLRSEWALAG